MDTPVALITGAGRGIGRAAAIALARAGYRLALVARTDSDLLQTAQLARPDGGAIALPLDVSDPGQAQSAVSQAVSTLGRLDALINIAGVAPVRSIEEMAVEEWRTVIDTNLSAVFYLAHAAWPHLRRSATSANPSALVNISSLAARDPFPGFAAYAAAKAGLHLLGLVAAREGQRDQIVVHTIAPGAVDTEMFRRLRSPQEYPSEKCLSPDEVADLIVQCATGKLRNSSGEVLYLQKSP